MAYKGYQFKKSLPKVNLETKGKVFIPESVVKKINYLCKTISRTEWSAMLFYNITEGSLEDLENLKLELVDLYLQDIGTVTTTEFDIDEKLIDVYEEDETLEDCRIGSIHSHNHMGAFFSGTDNQDMEDNCQVHNVYLSVVVNNKGDKVAKIAIPLVKSTVGKTTTSFIFKDDAGKEISLEDNEDTVDTKEDSVLMIELDIEQEIEDVPFNKTFIDRVTELVTKKKTPTHTTYGHSNYNHDNYGYGGSHGQGHGLRGSEDEVEKDDKSPKLTNAVVCSFLEHYMSANGTGFDITGILALYQPLYKVGIKDDLEKYIEECDEHMIDILEVFEDKGFDKLELLKAAIKEMDDYTSLNFKRQAVAIKESLTDYGMQFFGLR